MNITRTVRGEAVSDVEALEIDLMFKAYDKLGRESTSSVARGAGKSKQSGGSRSKSVVRKGGKK